MSKFVQIVAALIGILIVSFAFAGTSVLGTQIGVTTLDEVQKASSGKIRPRDAGTNKYTNGAMLSADGTAYDVDGLKNVLYIFDVQKKLAAIVLVMDKSKFNFVFDSLAKKYKVSEQQRPFVGNQYARFKTPDSTIVISARHLEFEMEVQYIRDDLMKIYLQKSKADTDNKLASDAAKL